MDACDEIMKLLCQFDCNPLNEAFQPFWWYSLGMCFASSFILQQKEHIESGSPVQPYDRLTQKAYLRDPGSLTAASTCCPILSTSTEFSCKATSGKFFVMKRLRRETRETRPFESVDQTFLRGHACKSAARRYNHYVTTKE